MTKLNLTTQNTLEENYQSGLLPQRNQKNTFYQESSCRSNLSNSTLSSENRRIVRKTDNFSFQRIPLDQFQYTPQVQKQCHDWVKQLGWEFPTSSIKTVFTNHIFNYVYVWKDQNDQIVAYGIALFTDTISHIAYVFYDPAHSHGNLPIRLVLQVVIDSQQLGLKYCYLGRFSPSIGFYKRNMPGFEYFESGSWQPYINRNSQILYNTDTN